jgi:hypothetical protein
MHLVALAGLAIGCAVFSGCASEGSTSGRQQKTPVNTHARDQVVFLQVGSILQKTRDIKPARRTRCTTVREQFDATTAPIRDEE